MAKNITTLMIPNKIRTWVFAIRSFSSLSGAIQPQHQPELSQYALNSPKIDPKIQYLKNNLCPHNLIRVLNGTHDLNSVLKVFKWASLQKQFKHTAGTYSSVILKLGFAGNVDEMEAFCREMVNDKCRCADEALGAVLDVFVSCCRLDEAMRVVLVINSCGLKLCVSKWEGLLGALVEHKRDFRDVLLVYKEMVKSGTLPNVDVLNCLIRALFDANMVDKALDQFRRMGKKRCVPTCRTFEIVVCGLVATNLVDEALGVMNEMFRDGVSPDLSFCTNVIPLLCKENKVEPAMKLFAVMRRSKFEPDFHTYSALIKCLCLNMRFSEAIDVFHKMRESGFNPTPDVLVDVLDACCKLGNLDEAKILLDDNCVPDPSPYNVVLKGYCDAHYFLSAKDLFQRMLLADNVDNLSWNILICGLCSVNHVKQAYEVLGKMIISSYFPDCATYFAFVTGKCSLGKYEDALELFREMKSYDWILDPYSFDELIRGLCNLEKFQEAAEVFMYMTTRNSTLQPSFLSCLIKGFCVTARVDEAIRLLKFGQCYGNSLNISEYTGIIECLVRLARPYEGLALLSQVLKRGLLLDVEAYCILIQCMVALSKTKHCVLLLNLMLSKGLFPDSGTVASLVSHLAKCSKLHTVWKSIYKLCQETEVIDPDLYKKLINGLCKEGRKTEACQLLDYMLEKGWVPDASTHRLLIGSKAAQEAELQISRPDNLVVQDEVSNILSEGLGEI